MGAERQKGHWGSGEAMLGPAVLLLFLHAAVAQFASDTYFMDSTSDCYRSGYLLVSGDGVVNVHSRKPNGPATDVQQCTMRFRPEDTRHIIDVQVTDLTISDPGVTLHVDVTGGGTYTLTAGSRKPSVISSKGGLATITLSHLSLDDRDYAFTITIHVYKEDDGLMNVDDSPGPVGLIVGLITGIVAFLIFLAILIVCCYRRKKEQYRSHERSHKADLAAETLSPSASYGLDNAAQRGMITTPPRRDPEAEDYDYENYSPRMERKPLTPPADQFDYRDRSGSDSDSKDRYIMRDYNRSPRKTPGVTYEDENPRNSWQESRKQRDYGRGEGNFDDQKQTPSSRSPELNTQRSNPGFRPEREVAPRTPRMKGESSENDSVSDTSSRERINRGDVSSSQKPQAPEKTPRKQHPLPPVSRSPKAPVDQENTSRGTLPQQQDTPRNTQPNLGPSSSSSSETEQTREGRGDAYPEDKVPFTASEEKTDTRHTLRPDRTKKKKSPEKAKASPESIRTEPANSTKPAKEKSKPAKTSKANKKAGSQPGKQDAPEYEGRFKKADSAKKSKSKAPRMGRSRSTGNAVDDTDSIGRGSVSSAGGYRAVPSVTADDYEDSDAESNYNPLRRTTSKTSLYASRSSLYGRRRRKNSFGESVYSVAYDDPDTFDRGSVKDRSLSRRHRGFKSLGDLQMELREQSAAATQALRETAPQARPRKGSVSSTSGRPKPRDRKLSASSASGRPKRAKSESELRRKAREEDDDRPSREKPALRPKPRPRKSTSTVDDGSLMTRGSDPSSHGGTQPAIPVYAPQGYPGYMVGYPPQMPYGMVPVLPGIVVPNPGAAVPNFGAAVPNFGAAVPGGPTMSGPPTAPKPAMDKWDMLCRITDTAKEIDDGESVAGSVFSS